MNKTKIYSFIKILVITNNCIIEKYMIQMKYIHNLKKETKIIPGHEIKFGF